VLTTARWLLLALFVEQTAIMIFVQTLHAASFGVYHAVAIHLVHSLFVGRHQGRGQALYSSLSFGAGGAVGSLLAGYLWEGVGAQWMYVSASVAALLAGLVAWRGIREEKI
jgi:PPP family 3-phenylpropionic acid transporter